MQGPNDARIGKRRDLGLGSLDTVPLAEARQLLDLSQKNNRDKRFADTVVEAPIGFHSKKVILASTGNARILGSRWRVPVSKPEADELVATQGFKIVGHV